MSAPKHVFIVGCRRSGTTWTMLLAGQHPEVVALQQLDFFRRLDHFGRWFATDQAYGTCILTHPDAPAARAASAPRGQANDPSPSDGLARLPLSAAVDRSDFVAQIRPLATEVYARFAACGETTRAVVEQTPEYVHVWPTILEVFPDAHFVHVVRDPRSVYASHRNAARSWADPTRFSPDAIEVGREWTDEVTRARAIAGATDRYLELRYEDLRADPVPNLARLFSFLDLEADEDLCRRAVDACSMERLQKSSSIAPKGFFRKGEVAGWRKELSAGQIRTIEHLCSDLMRDLDYPLDNPSPVAPPLRLRWRRGRERAGDALRRWAWNDESAVRRGVSRVLKLFPGLRKVLLRRIKNPA